MNKKRLSMEFDVTVMLDVDGNVQFEFYHPESGDFSRICTTLKNADEEETRVGGELLSWLPLMADMVEAQEWED